MMIFALAMLLVAPQCQGLALVPRSVRTALVRRFAPAQLALAASPSPSSSSSPVLYAQMSDLMVEAVDGTEETMTVDSDYTDFSDVDAFRNEMLNLVYERSMERLMN